MGSRAQPSHAPHALHHNRSRPRGSQSLGPGKKSKAMKATQRLKPFSFSLQLLPVPHHTHHSPCYHLAWTRPHVATQRTREGTREMKAARHISILLTTQNRGSIWSVVSLGQETKHMAICSTINTNIINSILLKYHFARVISNLNRTQPPNSCPTGHMPLGLLSLYPRTVLSGTVLEALPVYN